MMKIEKVEIQIAMAREAFTRRKIVVISYDCICQQDGVGLLLFAELFIRFTAML